MSNKDKEPKFVTEGGKEIIIKNIPGTGLLEIVFASGGERPKEFEGSFTDFREAERVIGLYLASRAAGNKPKKVA